MALVKVSVTSHVVQDNYSVLDREIMVLFSFPPSPSPFPAVWLSCLSPLRIWVLLPAVIHWWAQLWRSAFFNSALVGMQEQRRENLFLSSKPWSCCWPENKLKQRKVETLTYSLFLKKHFLPKLPSIFLHSFKHDGTTAANQDSTSLSSYGTFIFLMYSE